MTHSNEAEVVGRVPKGLFVGGEWVQAEGGGTFEVHDPATGEVLAEVADGTRQDSVAALDAAVAAQAGWAATPARRRSEILRRAYELVVERTEDLALLMTLEMGKPVADSRGEVAYGAEFFRWFSEEAVRIDGRFTPEPNGRGDLVVMRQPVGPALLITPWNFPLAMGTRKIGPALAAGCTMVLKPAALTPLTSLALVGILAEAGVPPGVVNLLTTSRAGDVSEPLLADGRLRKLSFTGSTPVGRALTALAAPNLQRVSMELGGNAPFLVFADADVDAAVDGAVIAKMRNMGEACTAANRFLVHASVADRFSSALAERMAGMRVGRGTEEGVQVGPLVEEKARAKVSDLVGSAVAAGAETVLGGRPIDGPGWFYEPTVLTEVEAGMSITEEEIFGPVAAIRPFTDDDEALAAANDTPFGLVAYAYTRDLARAMHVAKTLQSGMVGINTGIVSNPAAPFGGVKQSGLGREGGHEGIAEYLDVKYVGLVT